MNGEEVGKISYSVVIDVAALKSGAKSAEQAIKTTFNSSEQAVAKSSKQMQSSIGGTVSSLVSLTAALLAAQRVGDFLGDSIKSANDFQAALIGLDSISKSYGASSRDARDAAVNLSSDGIIPLTQSAQALKNLLSSGFSVPEAIELLAGLKDQAAFNRQSFYDLGGAVVATTEGIKNGNSVLADATGTTKNLSNIAKDAGVSVDEMGNIQQNAAYRTAILNGFLESTNHSLGDAQKYADTAAGADARLSYAVNNLKIETGDLANVLRKDAISELANFISTNQDTIISVAAGAAGFTAMLATIQLAPKVFAGANIAITAFRASSILATQATAALVAGNTTLSASLLALRANAIRAQLAMGAIGVISIAVGLAAGVLVNNMLDASDSTEQLDETTKDLSDSQQEASKTSKDLQKKLQDLDDQVAKTNRDYEESLARIVKDHQDSVKTLTKQIEDENKNYDAAVKKRFTSFQEEQGKEEDAHQLKVKKLQNQIDFLRKYNNASNQQQLSDLQFALAKENTEYIKRNDERQATYDADAQSGALSHQQKLDDQKKKLDEETALLDKHAADVRSIRDVILLDEIDGLRRSREEQLKSLEQQRQDIVSKLSTAYSQAGSSAADAFKKAFGAQGIFFDAPTKYDVQKVGGKTVVTPQFASGGFTGTGGVNQPAGVVHKGEFVLPQHMVNQASGLPKPEAVAAISGGAATNITINLSGVMSSGPADERAIAQRIVQRFNEVLKSQGKAQLGVA